MKRCLIPLLHILRIRDCSSPSLLLACALSLQATVRQVKRPYTFAVVIPHKNYSSSTNATRVRAATVEQVRGRGELMVIPYDMR